MGYEVKDLPGPFDDVVKDDRNPAGLSARFKAGVGVFLLVYIGILYGVYCWCSIPKQAMYEQQASLEQQIIIAKQQLLTELSPASRQKLEKLLELIAQQDQLQTALHQVSRSKRNLAWGGQAPTE